MNSQCLRPKCAPCLLLSVWVLGFAMVEAQEKESVDSLNTVQRQWKETKKDYLEKVNLSRDSILSQLESSEVAARSEGNIDALKLAKEARRAFIETAEIAATIDRKEYDEIRRKALEEFTASRKELMVKLLKNGFDEFAEAVDAEFKQLAKPIVSDAQARWAEAVDAYREELSEADVLILAGLDELEATARRQAKPDELEAVKRARASFVDDGTVSGKVSRKAYDSIRKQAADRLAKANTELVRTLLINKLDEQAKRMSAALEQVTNPSLEVANNKVTVGTDSRRRWDNKSNKTIIQMTKGGDWQEVFNSDGSVVRRQQEMDRTDEYVELFLLDRKQLMRLYDDHADLYKDNRWQEDAKGSWMKPDGE